MRISVARLTCVACVIATFAAAPMLAAAASRAPVKGGRYAGLIGPGYPMSFRVSRSGKSVTDLVVAFEETCNGSAGDTPPKFHFDTLALHRGTFAGRSTDHFGKTVSEGLRISGAIKGHTASGKVTDVSKIKSLATCTQSEPFTAKLK